MAFGSAVGIGPEWMFSIRDACNDVLRSLCLYLKSKSSRSCKSFNESKQIAKCRSRMKIVIPSLRTLKEEQQQPVQDMLDHPNKYPESLEGLTKSPHQISFSGFSSTAVQMVCKRSSTVWQSQRPDLFFHLLQ